MSWIASVLTSVRGAIITLLLVSVACVIGSIIPQGESPENLIERFKYSKGAAEFVYGWQLDHVFSTTVFRVILFYLCVSVAFCTVKRVLAYAAINRNTDPVRPKEFLDRMPIKAEGQVPVSPKVAAERIAASFRAEGYTTFGTTTDDGSEALHARMNPLAWAGDLFLHISIIIVLAGGLAGSLWGYSFARYIPTGTSIEIPTGEQFKVENEYRNLKELIHQKIHGGGAHPEAELDRLRKLEEQRKAMNREPLFVLRIDDYKTIRLPEDPTIVDTFVSTATVLEGGKVVKDKLKIEVNEPLGHKGMMIYQQDVSSEPLEYGSFEVVVYERETNEPVWTGVVDLGKSIPVPDVDPDPVVTGFYPEFALDQKTMTGVTRSMDLNLPALEVTMGVGSKDKRWVFVEGEHFPMEKPYGAHGIYLHNLRTVREKETTGLRIAHDPGVDLVWIGSAMIMIGLCINFYYVNRRIFFVITPRETGSGVLAYAKAGKTGIGFPRDFALSFERALHAASAAPAPPPSDGSAGGNSGVRSTVERETIHA